MSICDSDAMRRLQQRLDHLKVLQARLTPKKSPITAVGEYHGYQGPRSGSQGEAPPANNPGHSYVDIGEEARSQSGGRSSRGVVTLKGASKQKVRSFSRVTEPEDSFKLDDDICFTQQSGSDVLECEGTADHVSKKTSFLEAESKAEATSSETRVDMHKRSKTRPANFKSKLLKAMSNYNKKEEKRLHRPHLSQERLADGARFVRDALLGRRPVDVVSSFSLKCYRIHSHAVWRVVFHTFVITHCALSIFMPPHPMTGSFHKGGCPSSVFSFSEHGYIVALEVVCFCIYCADFFFLCMSYGGLRQTFSHGWHRGFAAVLCVVGVDILVAATTPSYW